MHPFLFTPKEGGGKNSQSMTRLPAVARSKWILYGLGIVLLLGGISWLGTLDTASFQTYYLLAQALALGVGILHVWLGERFGYLTYDLLFLRNVLPAFLLMLAGMIVSLVLYQFTGHLADRWTFVTSLIPFLIPVLVVLAYQYFLAIPAADYKKWYYPINGDMPDIDLIDLSKILVIQFEFLKTPEDRHDTNFKAKAPVAMSLGDLFLVFINDYNERTPASQIVFTHDTGQPYGWVFSKKAAWWQRPRFLDPELNFSQNYLNDNDTIIAHRVA
ncbi:hypothetical protein GCM10023187_02240 [Nibrella viscosa]|uniref:Uncharacterized protein n=1 Tax=Nibrella viscosa TaxID=1084524 RepID=A0ABP8JS96_9BACT